MTSILETHQLVSFDEGDLSGSTGRRAHPTSNEEQR